MEDREDAISWNVLTHTHKERSTDWYWAFALVALLSIGASVFFENYMLAIILFVGLGSMSILAIRGPREHSVRIDKKGVTIDGTRYPYKTIQTFWVAVDEPNEAVPPPEREEPKARLFLTTNGFISPHIHIPLDHAAHAQEVRTYLLQFVEEQEQRPYIAEHLAEILGL